MAVWKQVVAALVVLAVAGWIWVSYVPGAATVLSSIGLDWLAGESPAKKAGGPGNRRPGGRGAPPVTVAPVTTATINNRLSAIGDGQAIRSVTIKPSVSGRLVEVIRRSGDRVVTGDVIARLDAEAERIASDRARLAVKNAEAALERAERLMKSNTVSSVQVTDLTLALENAKLQQRDAELALQRRSITAPIDGILGILPIEVGDYVTTDTEIATIDDRSHIIVEFRVPERFVSAIEIGSPMTATAVSRPGQIFNGVVTAIDSRVERDSRTLRVQADLDNGDDELRGGMSFAVEMRFPGDTYPAVDPLAIQWSTDGAYVWSVREGRAKRVPVHIIQRNIDQVLVDASLEIGSPVITEGVQAVRQGAEVFVAGNRPADSGDTEAGDTALPSGS
jgi:RND family efflux transporter MFP subunit